MFRFSLNSFLICIVLFVLPAMSGKAETPDDPLAAYDALPGKIVFTEFKHRQRWIAGGSGAFDYASHRYPLVGNNHFTAITGKNSKPSYVQGIRYSGFVDITRLNLAVLIRVDDITNWRSLEIHVGDRNLKNHRRYRNLLRQTPIRLTANGKWALLAFPLTQKHTRHGRSNLNVIESIRVSLAGKGEKQFTYHVQAIALFRN